MVSELNSTVTTEGSCEAYKRSRYQNIKLISILIKLEVGFFLLVLKCLPILQSSIFSFLSLVPGAMSKQFVTGTISLFCWVAKQPLRDIKSRFLVDREQGSEPWAVHALQSAHSKINFKMQAKCKYSLV